LAGSAPELLKSPDPSSDEAREAFDLYTSAVGRVAYAWNRLQEGMAELFVRVVGGQNADTAEAMLRRSLTEAVWHSSFNDRLQRQMLEAAVMASRPDPVWRRLPRGASDDLVWLIRRANHLGDRRDEVVHAPVALTAKIDGISMEADYLSAHRRARSLVHKDPLVEFDWLERSVLALTRFAEAAYAAMRSERAAWPQRPSAPERRQRKTLLNRLRRSPLK
jgi:hypothetical protein